MQILKQNVKLRDGSRSPDRNSKESKSNVDSQETFKHVIYVNDKPTDPNTTSSGINDTIINLNQLMTQKD